jgi:NitT/TauT family transport system permease protein
MMTSSTSLSRQRYLAQIRRRRRLITATRWGLLLALFALWEAGAQLGLINDFLLSSPSRMVRTAVSLIQSGELFLHIGTTLFETLAGFAISAILGTALAVLLWWSVFWNQVLDPYLVVLNSLPKIALGPVLIVWIGAGMPAIIAMAVMVSVIVTLVTTLAGFCEIEPEKIMLMRSFGATKRQILTMVVLPGSVPAMLSALKLNIGLSWVGVIVGEFLVSRAGLGYLTVYGGQVFKLDLVMTSTVILCLLAGVMYFVVAGLEKRARSHRQ